MKDKQKREFNRVLVTHRYSYLGIVVNTEENLKDYLQWMKKNSNKIIQEINAIEAKRQVGKQKIRVKLKLFETCLLHNNTTWSCILGKILKRKMTAGERIQSKALKQLLQVRISSSKAGVLMEAGIWPTKKHFEYSTMMLYQSINNGEEERIVKKLVKEKLKYNNIEQTFCNRFKSVNKAAGVDIWIK